MDAAEVGKQKPYSFKLLKDEVEKEDLFEDKTHEKVADSIASLIQSVEGGVTIGLEGSWGSGKSTVISLLKDKLKINSSIKLIQFDAWAHQGDPLRRIFLESLIDEINKDNNTALNDLKDKISKRKKIITIKTKRSATLLGKAISISAFFVPVGLALMSLVKNLVFIWGGVPNFVFIVASLCTSMPLVILFCNIIYLYCQKRKGKILKVFEGSNWAFLQEDTTKDVNQEISEDEEKSSIEFEEYFKKIIELFFKNLADNARLVLVIDNLDRVNSKDALTIWATLQTFIQQRSHIKRTTWFNKIWIIIPYDPEGLALLWSKDGSISDIQNLNIDQTKNDKNNREKTNDEISKAFFDKNFQIRFEVPKQVISGWENFSQKLINKALFSWSESEKKDALRILGLTRKNLNDIPTPREIKNYINQLAILVSQTQGQVPVASISYYVVLRLFNNKPKKEIREKLINGDLPDKNQIPFLPDTIKKDIAGLIFGVSSEKGNIMLLDPEIKRILSSGDDKKIKELAMQHEKDFWSVFNYHVNHSTLIFNDIINYSRAIYHAFGEEYISGLDVFIYKIKGTIRNNPITLEFNNEWEIDSYTSIIELCKGNNKDEFLEYLYHATISFFKTYLTQEKSITKSCILFFDNLKNQLNKNNIYFEPYVINITDLKKILQWSKQTFAVSAKSWEIIVPSNDITELIGNTIQPDVYIFEGLIDSIKYIIKGKIDVDWNYILDQCQKHINNNNGTFRNHSEEIFDIITLIGLSSNANFQKVKSLISSGQYLYLFNQRHSSRLLPVALIYGFIIRTELHKMNPPNHITSVDGFNKIKTFWKTNDPNNATNVVNYLKTYNKFLFIWELAKDPQNKLVGDIIDIALEDQDLISFFNTEDAVNKIGLYNDLKDKPDEEKIQKLSELFIKHSHIEDEILKNENLDLVKLNFELFFIIKTTSNADLIKYIGDRFKSLSKEVWLEELETDTYLTSLAVELNEIYEGFESSHTYADALIEFCKSTEKVTDWQKGHWEELLNLLSIPYKKEFKNEMTNYYVSQKGNVSNLFFELSRNYLDKPKILKEENLVEDMVHSAIKEENFELLAIFTKLFTRDDVKEYYKKDNDRIKDLASKVDDNNKILLTNISELLEIGLD